jgi:hypothetical protein
MKIRRDLDPKAERLAMRVLERTNLIDWHFARVVDWMGTGRHNRDSIVVYDRNYLASLIQEERPYFISLIPITYRIIELGQK